MSQGWAAVIGVSVVVMAVVQLVLLIGLIVAMQRAQARMRELERRVQATVDEVQPQLVALIEEVRGATLSVQGLAANLRERLDTMDDAARSVRARAHRVADTVQWAATSLPLPVKFSGPAAMAAWAGVRVARNLFDRARLRRAAHGKTPRAVADLDPAVDVATRDVNY